jgi:excinuclease ABC subunit C
MKEQTEIREKLHQLALDAPKTSGVYLWKDENGGVIYVGKAKSLKNRLSSYFVSGKDLKTRILVSRARTIEYITTDNEYEALLLENTLIKEHSPRYNINLKDGKSYPVVKVTNEPFPRVYRTRTIRNDGARYYGPFPNVAALDQFLDFVKRAYHFRQCRRLVKRAAPCLYYHIGRCCAPCCGKVTEEEYRRELSEFELLIAGDDDESIARLEAAMRESAASLAFERAARLRDGIAAIRELRGRNAVVDMDPESRDYVAWAAEGTMVTFAVLQMRAGRLVGRDLYRARSLMDEEDILPEFLMAYYADASRVPARIFVPTERGLELAARWLAEGLGTRVDIEVVDPGVGDANAAAEGDVVAESAPPAYGDDARAMERRHRAAMAMARFNAREDAARRLRERGDFPALEELRSVLSLPDLPHRIEGFDIAHIGGRLPVASLISFRDGNPDRKNYRMYRLRTTDGIIDDFASMREVASRRYSRLVNDGDELPDLIMVDGGLGQVNAVRGVLEALGVEIPIVGLAKRDEELYLPGRGEPLKLPRRSDALRLLQRVRDETHRFATSRNQRLRTKENTTLAFESLPGIGPRKAARLLKTFSTLEELARVAASGTDGRDAISRAAGLSEAQATELVAALPALLAEREAERGRRAAGGAAAESVDVIQLAQAALSQDKKDASLNTDKETHNK